MGLSVKEEIHGLITTFHFHGKMNLATRNSLELILAEIVDVDLLIFDFSEIEWMDSTFIQSILKAIDLSIEQNFTIKFHGKNESIKETFEDFGIYQILDTIHEEAIV
jgi:anti-anti-sigma regulatory factor